MTPRLHPLHSSPPPPPGWNQCCLPDTSGRKPMEDFWLAEYGLLWQALDWLQWPETVCPYQPGACPCLGQENRSHKEGSCKGKCHLVHSDDHLLYTRLWHEHPKVTHYLWSLELFIHWLVLHGIRWKGQWWVGDPASCSWIHTPTQAVELISSQ